MSSKLANRLLSASIVVAAAALLLLALLFADTDATAQAQTLDTPTAGPSPEQPDHFGEQRLPPIEGKLNPPKYPNMDSSLNRIVEQVQTGQFTAQAAAESAPIHREESVAVTLYVTEGYAQSVWDYLEQSGASPRNIGIDYIEAYVPVSLLPDASTQEGVISIRTIIPPQPAQGTVVSEGAEAHGVPAWHAAGYKGQGVKIGIIDTGFENFQNLMGTELPSTVEARCYTDIRMATSDLEDCTYSEDHESRRLHGTAVTEAVFDIAPEATYYISNPRSWGDLKSTVEWMTENDVKVINHSVGWAFDGPGDGTSPYSDSPLNSVDAAVAGGITWVNAAGNSALGTWYGPFKETDGDGLHEFRGSDNCNNYAIYSESEILAATFLEETNLPIQLRWDDSWGGANRDLALILFRFNEEIQQWIIYDYSNSSQSGEAGHIPFEFIHITVPAGAYCLAIAQISVTTPNWIQLQHITGRLLEHHTISGSITNPAESANPGLLAVGAAHWRDTSIIEPFSSQGPTPDDRTEPKPDIVGADGGRSVSYISEERPDGSWGGTSQASPHVAGLAALVKQRSPADTPQQVADYLKSNAEERGEAVPNNTWGYGFAMLPERDATTPEPTATPIAPAVPVEVLDRLSALETIVAYLQELISALDVRIADLEGDAASPAPTPTPAPVAPTPTPAPVAPTPTPAPVAPTPTPAPGETPVPTPTPPASPTPIADECVMLITGDSEITAESWDSACLSTNRPLDPNKPDNGEYYARYYTFNLSAPALVTIDLTSNEDTFLYLLNGIGRTGAVEHYNDDIEYAVITNSRIEQTLQAGDYTIEATTYNSDKAGSRFTLTVRGIE